MSSMSNLLPLPMSRSRGHRLPLAVGKRAMTQPPLAYEVCRKPSPAMIRLQGGTNKLLAEAVAEESKSKLLQGVFLEPKQRSSADGTSAAARGLDVHA